ncbi:MAG: hypothetical protein HYV04_02825, partial [Deltaproteobacteria bacterium]|nr:hypothetical protein [Deltaproteobacteria bacterium]
MRKHRLASLIVLGVFLGCCAQMSYRQQAAVSGAITGATLGGAAGAGIGHVASDDKHREGIGGAIGAATGA